MLFNLVINQKQQYAFHAATQNHKCYEFLIIFVLMTEMHAFDALSFIFHYFAGKGKLFFRRA